MDLFTTGYDMIIKEQQEQSSPIHSTKTSVNTDKKIEKWSMNITLIIFIVTIISCVFTYLLP